MLLHGLGHRRQAWRPVLGALAAEHDVVAPDLPGFGGSAAPGARERYDIAWLVDTVALFCERLGLERPHLAGNSLGGAIALELAARGFAASVAAFSPIGFTTARENLGNRLLTLGMGAAARVPEHVRVAMASSPPARAVARRVLRGDPKGQGSRDLRFDATVISAGSPFARLAPEVAAYSFGTSAPTCPVTIGWGNRDRILPPRAARRAAEHVGRARLVTLMDCGHVPMADRPELVASVVLETTRAAERTAPAPA
ncbi:alpha/beta fold hydrolase [Actinorugispora endophytica]|uniref:Pimeloyl-ACP methyl ester carboxylesterase n=1 Tax=Actinorugispora endophytica TaxID=1605990 RepID=A0A4R6UZW8_9ACTN|nr:alpha/beta fold hydrolase [Actinorugispora endophytica]TDQ52955.1 pimeloyl-ACP methyl ester carboxylesterase [Actinorugispora endophytica]